jgi:osmotically-inducible protein OsmY
MKRLTAVLLFTVLFTMSTVGAFAQKNRSDDQIYDMVRQKLANDPDVKGGALQVDVKDGVVTIRGEVEKDKQRQKAERLAHKVKGVKSVNNQLTLKK